MYLLWVLANTVLRPRAPRRSRRARTLRAWRWRGAFSYAMVPPLVLIFLVLGTIFIGWATPTRAAPWARWSAHPRRREIQAQPKGPVESLEHTAKITSFRAVHPDRLERVQPHFAASTANLWVEHLLTGLPGGALGFLSCGERARFVLAFFLDFFEISFIILPCSPGRGEAGIDLVWFACCSGSTCRPPSCHPRSASHCLPALGGAAEVKTTQIYWARCPFVAIQLVAVALIITFPGLVGSGVDARRPAPGRQRRSSFQPGGLRACWTTRTTATCSPGRRRRRRTAGSDARSAALRSGARKIQ